MIHLTSGQIIEEIEKACGASPHTDDSVFTFKELRKLLGGMSSGALYKRLDLIEEAGRLECSRKMVETRVVVGGKRVWRPVPAYRILPE